METVVLLPAAATTGRMWRWQAEALTWRFRVLTPDLPGHGDAPGPFTLERAVAEVSGRSTARPRRSTCAAYRCRPPSRS